MGLHRLRGDLSRFIFAHAMDPTISIRDGGVSGNRLAVHSADHLSVRPDKSPRRCGRGGGVVHASDAADPASTALSTPPPERTHAILPSVPSVPEANRNTSRGTPSSAPYLACGMCERRDEA
jgi:hypothetical protein